QGSRCCGFRGGRSPARPRRGATQPHERRRPRKRCRSKLAARFRKVLGGNRDWVKEISNFDSRLPFADANHSRITSCRLRLTSKGGREDSKAPSYAVKRRDRPARPKERPEQQRSSPKPRGLSAAEEV